MNHISLNERRMNNLYQEPLVIELKCLNPSVLSENWYKIEIDKSWKYTVTIDQKESPSIEIDQKIQEELFRLIKKIQIPIWIEDTSSQYLDATAYNCFKISCNQYSFECVWMDEDKNTAMDSLKDIATFIGNIV